MSQTSLEDSGLIKRQRPNKEKVVKPLWTGGTIKVVEDKDH